MGFQIDRPNGQHYAENIVDPLLLFDNGTWTVSSGTGFSTLSTVKKFVGDSSLRLENNAPASDLIATNSVQSTVIDTTDVYNLSWYALKINYLEAQDASVLVYKNAVLIRTEDFTLGSVDPDFEQNDTWVRFQSDQSILFELGDVITFQFKIKGITTVNPVTSINFDGLMLNPEGRLNKIVPEYNKPAIALSEDTVQKLYDTPGWGFYVEDQTVASTQIITTTSTLLQIDGLGATSNNSYLPHEIRGISELWDSATSKILPINIGDGYTLRMDLEITAKSGSPTELVLDLDIGGLATPTINIVERIIGTGKTPPYTVSVGLPFFSLTTFLTNGGQVFLRTDTGTVTLTKRQISIHRISNGSL